MFSGTGIFTGDSKVPFEKGKLLNWKILAEFTPDIEVYSIDEIFLQFKGFENYNLYDYGLSMKQRVMQLTRIPVSIGYAPTKALAKVANKIAKKYPEITNGVYIIKTEKERIKALKWLKIEDVWGVGRQFAKKLKAQKAY